MKIVELSSANGKDGYRVERYAIEVLPKDAVSDGNIANLDGVVDCVKRAWKRMGTSTKNVAMALPRVGGDHQEDHRPRTDCAKMNLKRRSNRKLISTFRFQLTK